MVAPSSHGRLRWAGHLRSLLRSEICSRCGFLSFNFNAVTAPSRAEDKGAAGKSRRYPPKKSAENEKSKCVSNRNN